MSLLGSILPGILGSLNPANIIRGVINTGTGILDNISKGRPLDISGNLSRGLKSLMASPDDEQSALGSIGGQNTMEPTYQEKMLGARNAANMSAIARMNAINRDLRPSAERNAANYRGVYSEDRTRTSDLGNSPVNEMIDIGDAVESAPGGMPDRRIAIVHSGRRAAPKTNVLNSRDQFGYKSIPVVMTGVRHGMGRNTHERAALSHERKEPKVKIDDEVVVKLPKFRMEKKKRKK